MTGPTTAFSDGTLPGVAPVDVALPEGMTADDLQALDRFIPPLRGLGRVGVLGGSFNPPHLAHVMAALAVYATEELDHLWVIPTASHAFGKDLAPFADRVRMAHLAFRHFAGGVAVLDLEERLPRPSYTVNLLRALHRLRPGIKPVWIAGSDFLVDLPRWREPDEVVRLARFVVLPRQGHPLPEAHQKILAVVDDDAPAPRAGVTLSPLSVDLPQLSSSDVRARLRAGQGVRGLLDHEVLAYVDRRGLYRDEP
jgi:nicotinate-nucleotide adenylyltransferase